MSLTSPIHVGALIYVSGSDGCIHPTTIARVMPTQIMTDCGRRFRLRLPPFIPGHRTAHIIGLEVGHPSHRACLPTARIITRYRRECAERAESRAKRQGFTENEE
jgi:hypothetical protein